MNSPISPCFYCRLPFFIPSCSFLLSQSANMRSLLFGKARCVQVGAVGQIACLGSPGSCYSARCARTSVALTGNSAAPNWAGLRCRWIENRSHAELESAGWAVTKWKSGSLSVDTSVEAPRRSSRADSVACSACLDMPVRWGG